MEPADVAFLGGVFWVPLALASAIAAIVRLPPGRTKQIHVTAAGACVIVFAGALVCTFWWWGIAFDEAEANGVASSVTDRAMMTSFWIAVAASAGLALLGLTAVATYRGLTPNR